MLLLSSCHITGRDFTDDRLATFNHGLVTRAAAAIVADYVALFNRR